MRLLNMDLSLLSSIVAPAPYSAKHYAALARWSVTAPLRTAENVLTILNLEHGHAGREHLGTEANFSGCLQLVASENLRMSAQ